MFWVDALARNELLVSNEKLRFRSWRWVDVGCTFLWAIPCMFLPAALQSQWAIGHTK